MTNKNGLEERSMAVVAVTSIATTTVKLLSPTTL